MEVELGKTPGYSLVTGTVPSRQFCLCGGQSESTKFKIRPVVVGEIDIEATVRYVFYPRGLRGAVVMSLAL